MPAELISRRVLSLGIAVLISGSLQAGPGRLQQHPVAFHVHSTFSNGEYEVVRLAELASERGLGALVLTDSFLTTVTYGVWPFDRLGIEGLNRRVRPGVRDHGVDRYLDAVREAQRQFPEVLLIAGVEVTPFYFWRGKPWGDLSLHAFDRHLVVLGLSSQEIANLPVIGNETWANTEKDPGMLVLPLLLCGVGGLLLGIRWPRRVRLRRYTLARRERRWIPGSLFLILGGGSAWNNSPPGRLADPAPGGTGSYQEVIDYVVERGGVVYWSYPEARYPEVRMAGARMMSAPHPEDLLATQGYHGFEGLYGDTIRVTRPGGIWDHLLARFLGGERSSPPFVVTGIDFHSLRERGGWYELDGGQTLLLLAEKSPQEVLAALREGRSYATFQDAREKVRLVDFRVVTAGGESAVQGQTLSGPGPVTVQLHLDWLGKAPAQPPPFLLELILDGQVVERVEQDLPIRLNREHRLGPGRHYFRMHAAAAPSYEILSNPVFVTAD